MRLRTTDGLQNEHSFQIEITRPPACTIEQSVRQTGNRTRHFWARREENCGSIPNCANREATCHLVKNINDANALSCATMRPKEHNLKKLLGNHVTKIYYILDYIARVSVAFWAWAVIIYDECTHAMARSPRPRALMFPSLYPVAHCQTCDYRTQHEIYNILCALDKFKL